MQTKTALDRTWKEVIQRLRWRADRINRVIDMITNLTTPDGSILDNLVDSMIGLKQGIILSTAEKQNKPKRRTRQYYPQVNKRSHKDILLEILRESRGGSMHIDNIVMEMRNRGHTINSPTPARMVMMSVYNHKTLFKRQNNCIRLVHSKEKEQDLTSIPQTQGHNAFLKGLSDEASNPSKD